MQGVNACAVAGVTCTATHGEAQPVKVESENESAHETGTLPRAWSQAHALTRPHLILVNLAHMRTHTLARTHADTYIRTYTHAHPPALHTLQYPCGMLAQQWSLPTSQGPAQANRGYLDFNFLEYFHVRKKYFQMRWTTPET